MGLLCRLQQILLRSSLLTIYESFIRSWLDYVDIICDQAYKSTLHDKLEFIQYDVGMAITNAIRST